MVINSNALYTDSTNGPPFEIAHDEYIIKDYYAANIKKPGKGQAHIALTNKRAITYFWTKKGVLVNDAQISEVTATNVLWGERRRKTAGLISLCIGIIGYVTLLVMFQPLLFDPYYNSYYSQYYNSYFDYIIQQSSFIQMALIGSLLLIPIVMGIYLMIKQRVTFIIIFYIKSVTGAMTLHNYPQSGRLEGLLKPDQLKIDGKPGPDAKLMAKEIGALILDIQRGTIIK